MSNSAYFSMGVDDETELRLMEERQAPALYKLIDQNRVYLRQWLPWVDYQKSVEDSAAFIRYTLESFAHNSRLSVGIWHREQLVGELSLLDLEKQTRSAEVGYWMAEEFQGRGIMTRAVSSLLTYSFTELGLHRVVIKCATGNTRSCAIPERLGFTKEGVLRDGEWLYDHFTDLNVYSMLEHEWQNRANAAGKGS